jgi:hypothetical protein
MWRASSDPSLLAEIARRTKGVDWAVAGAAMRKLTQSDLIAQVAIRSTYASVAKEAVERLVGEPVLRPSAPT